MEILKLLFQIQPGNRSLTSLASQTLLEIEGDISINTIEIAKLMLEADSSNEIATELLINKIHFAENSEECLSLILFLFEKNILKEEIYNKVISLLKSYSYPSQRLTILSLKTLVELKGDRLRNPNLIASLISLIEDSVNDPRDILLVIEIMAQIDFCSLFPDDEHLLRDRLDRAISVLLLNSQEPLVLEAVSGYLRGINFNLGIVQDWIALMVVEKNFRKYFFLFNILDDIVLKKPELLYDFENLEFFIWLPYLKPKYVPEDIFDCNYYRVLKLLNQNTNVCNTLIELFEEAEDSTKYLIEQIFQDLNNFNTSESNIVEVEAEVTQQILREYEVLKSAIKNGGITNFRDLEENYYKVKYAADKDPFFAANLLNLSENIDDDMLRFRCLMLITENERFFLDESTLNKLIDLFLSKPGYRFSVHHILKLIPQPDKLKLLICRLKGFIKDRDVFSSNIENQDNEDDRNYSIYHLANDILWYCAKHMNYLDFYHTWYGSSSPTSAESTFKSCYRFLQLPIALSTSLTEDPSLNKTLKLVCIDAQTFTFPENPIADIYIEMIEQGCPKAPEGRPKTIADFKTYWRLDLQEAGKQVALILYNSEQPEQEFSARFLADLSKLGGAIVVVTDQNAYGLEQVSPNHPDLVNEILRRLRRRVWEA